MRWLILTTTHLVMLAICFAIGIYMLPILTAPRAPDPAALHTIASETLYTGRLVRNLKAEVPAGVDVRDYNAVVIWCEAFHQLISAAEYQASRQTRK